MGRTFCLLLSRPFFHLTYFIRMKCFNEHRIAADPSCTSRCSALSFPSPSSCIHTRRDSGFFQERPPPKRWQETHQLPADRDGAETHPQTLVCAREEFNGGRGREVSTGEGGYTCVHMKWDGVCMCVHTCVCLYFCAEFFTWRPFGKDESEDLSPSKNPARLGSLCASGSRGAGSTGSAPSPARPRNS